MTIWDSRSPHLMSQTNRLHSRIYARKNLLTISLDSMKMKHLSLWNAACPAFFGRGHPSGTWWDSATLPHGFVYALSYKSKLLSLNEVIMTCILMRHLMCIWGKWWLSAASGYWRYQCLLLLAASFWHLVTYSAAWYVICWHFSLGPFAAADRVVEKCCSLISKFALQDQTWLEPSMCTSSSGNHCREENPKFAKNTTNAHNVHKPC